MPKSASGRSPNSPIGLAFSKRILKLRRTLGLTQAQVEDLAPLARGSLCKLEKGERAVDPSIVTAVRLAQVYRVDVGWLITGVVPDGKWKPPMLEQKRGVD